MPAPRIPERQPIGDSFNGVVIKTDHHYLLADSAIDDYETTHTGTFMVRYGVVFLGKPHLSIVPALMALDYGEFLTGESAWDFLLNKSNLYPRADILGYRNDGQDDQVYVKQLDLLYPFDILVYADEHSTKPLCKIDAIISQNSEAIPARLRSYVNIFSTILDWQKALL